MATISQLIGISKLDQLKVVVEFLSLFHLDQLKLRPNLETCGCQWKAIEWLGLTGQKGKVVVRASPAGWLALAPWPKMLGGPRANYDANMGVWQPHLNNKSLSFGKPAVRLVALSTLRRYPLSFGKPAVLAKREF